MENHHANNGKTHYFYGHVQWQTVSHLAEAKSYTIPLNHAFPVVFPMVSYEITIFLWLSYGLHHHIHCFLADHGEFLPSVAGEDQASG